jgi:signal transduction histidine kinase
MLDASGLLRASFPAVTGSLSILMTLGLINIVARLARYFEQCEETNERLSLALDASGMGVFVWRSDAEVLQMDHALTNLLGLPGDALDIPFKSWLTQVHPRDQQRVDQVLLALWQGARDVDDLEFRWIHATKGLRHHQCKWRTELDKSGNVICVTGVIIDVSDLRKSMDQTQQAEARLGTIAANLPGVVVSFDLVDGRPEQVLYVSNGCREIWGLSPQELKKIPNTLFETQPGVQDLSLLRSLRHAAATLQPLKRRLEMTGEDGTSKWLDFHADVQRLDARRVRVDAIYLDVSREVATQQELQVQAIVAHRAQRQESIGHLAGGIAHDFNNLLAVILGNLELLREDINDAELSEAIETAISAANRGADLTRGMLAFARNSHLDPMPTNINVVVENTRKWVERVMPGNIDFETDLFVDLNTVHLDQAALEGALLNLVINGRDAMPGGGVIRVGTRNVVLSGSDIDVVSGEALTPGAYVRLTVTDTGTGIDNAILKHVFDPFFSTKEQAKGSGLGLAMVRGFVEQSGGGIRVENLEQGCRFLLYFPVMGQVSSGEPVQLQTPLLGGGLFQKQNVLFVEDDPEVRLVVKRTLEGFGLEVTVATTGAEALECFAQRPDFDLLLTDLMMPGDVQGQEVVEFARRARPEMPIVVLSGYGGETLQIVDANVTLTKPVSRVKLRGVLEEVLAGQSVPSASKMRE